ncbi:PIN domain-containing protein [Microbacterium halophytorum]|uniref:PIN domain-containing protein n=1 Tax=Microbacterium halophytorum TaxID=2067568 RepID=UPI000CFD2561|nr:PIN domain-containing protein [Microbacterium halophytorum]
MYSAILDSCVLWPSLQRDFLLSLAAERAYRPLWSTAILEETEINEAAKLVKRGMLREDAEARAHRLIAKMSGAFDDSSVAGWQRLEGSFGLPDVDDEHVLAAAVIGGAQAIVTLNLKDFPATLIPPSIEVLSPAEFASNTVRQHLPAAWSATINLSERSGRTGPARTPKDILDTLRGRYEMHDAVEALEVVYEL